MKRAAAAALVAALSVAALSSARADITDYEFRLVPDAVIFATRIDMAPDGMETMAAPIEALPSTEPGVYRFKTNLMMAGGWRLSLGAKIQGETGTIENKLVLKAVP
jgi:hypothetical protein